MPNQVADALDVDLDRMFRALADPTRRGMVDRLVLGPATVSELAEPFEMALPSVLQHLRVLEAGGLVRTEKVGRTRTCHLRPDALTRAEQWIDQRRRTWEQRLDRLEAYLEGTAPDHPTHHDPEQDR